MRKLLILSLMCSTLATLSFAQKKGDLDKPKQSNKASPPVKIDYSIPKIDTVKVIVNTYETTESGLKYVAWDSGYVLRTTKFEPKNNVKSEEIQQLVVAPDGTVGINKVTDIIYTKDFKLVKSKVQSVSVSDW